MKPAHPMGGVNSSWKTGGHASLSSCRRVSSVSYASVAVKDACPSWLALAAMRLNASSRSGWRSQAATDSIGAVWLGNQKSELRSRKTENRIHLTSDFRLLNRQPIRRGYDSTELAEVRQNIQINTLLRSRLCEGRKHRSNILDLISSRFPDSPRTCPPRV